MELSPLPWLVENGGFVWKGALAALAGSGLATAALTPRIVSRAQAKRLRSELGAPLSSLERLNDGARVTLTGTLEATAPLAARFEDGADAAATTVAYDPSGSALGTGAWRAGLNARAEGLHLVVGDQKVELRGPVEVIIGSREIRRRARFSSLPKPVQARIVAALGGARPHFSEELVQLRSLAPGDRVRVSGVLRKETRDGESGYRSAAARWTLVPVGEEGSVDQARGLKLAFEGQPAVTGPGTLLLARGVALGLVTFAAIFGLGGELASCSAGDDLASFQTENAWVRDLDLEVAATLDPRAHPASSLDTGRLATELAAATPLRRAQAIERWSDALDRRRDPDPRLIAYRAALAERRGDCAGAATTLAAHGFVEQGAEVAERCGDRYFAAGLRYTLGDVERASTLLATTATKADSDEQLRLAAKVHLLAGKTASAAAALRALAERFDAEAQGKHPVRANPHERAELCRCVALAIEARVGVAASREALDREERERDPSVAAKPAECLLLRADLAPMETRASLLEGVWRKRDPATDTPTGWVEQLLAEATPQRDVDGYHYALPDAALTLANPRQATRDRLPAVQKTIAESLVKDTAPSDRQRYARMYWALDQAAFEVGAGDRAEAKRWIAIATADLRTLNAADLERLKAAGFTPPGDDAITPELTPKWHRIQAIQAALLLDEQDVPAARMMMNRATYDGSLTLPAILDFREKGEIEKVKKSFLDWELIRQGESVNWAITAQGDGAALAIWLGRLDREPGSYLRIGAAMVRDGMKELGLWLRHGYRPARWHGDVEALLYDALNLRAVAAAVGDVEQEKVWSGRASGFRALLLRRETALPLGLIERL